MKRECWLTRGWEWGGGWAGIGGQGGSHKRKPRLLSFLGSGRVYLALTSLLPTERHKHHKFSSVTQLCPTPCHPIACSTPGFPVQHQLLGFAQTQVHRVGDAIQPSHLLCLLLLLPSIFPSIRVFSNESVLHIRWPNDWSFSFRISPSNEYSGLNSFMMDWLDLLAVIKRTVIAALLPAEVWTVPRCNRPENGCK